MPEGEANAHVNLAGDYLNLGEPARAHDHLQKAEAIFEQDVWYRWRYNIRLKSEYARYWIMRGDLASARAFRRRAREMIRGLADSVPDDNVRTRFLKSRSVRQL